MHRALSPKRLALIKALCSQEPMSIRELARRVDRDFKGVHTDVVALINAGIIEKEKDKIAFPYAGIHVEFDIEVAA
jgi:predicted transcriptional regulator